MKTTKFVCAMALGSTLMARGARAQDYVDLPGTQPGALDGGIPLESARPCGVSCHAGGEALGVGAMPHDTFVGSVMGNTLRDPLFLAALTVAEQDRRGIGDWCLRCHTPAGFVGGRTRGTPEASRGLALDLEDREGVSCDACHRMLPTENLGNAQYRLSPSAIRFGPHAQIESPRHEGAASPWHADARMCGTCHEVSNPTRRQRVGRDETARNFPLDTTFSEWSRSAFADGSSAEGRTCQDCHMPRVAGMARTSTYDSAPLRDRPRTHAFAGANAWVLRVLGAMRTEVASGEFYDPDLAPYYEAGARRAEAMLRDALSLEIRTAPGSAAAGARVEALVRVTNRAGHRVPTGYADGRRVWLEVALVDAAGRATVVSGAYDEATATLAEGDEQLALYEAWHGTNAGRGEHIALHDTVIRDTRLPPRGYRPSPGHEPAGADYAGGVGGALRHWDDRRYRFTLPTDASGPITLRVRAQYQVTTRAYVEFLARENRTDDRGRELLRRWEASGRAAPFTMAEARTTIALTATVDAGLADATATDHGTSPGVPPSSGCACRTGILVRPRWAGMLALLSLVGLRRRRR